MVGERMIRTGDDYAYEDEQGEHVGVRLLRETLEVGVMTLLAFLLIHLVVQMYRVDGPSMRPTLQNHEYILVNKAQYFVGAPQRGDVIVFAWPLDVSQDFVKRVIGVPGDTVQVDINGTVTVNGSRINEPYILDHSYSYEPHTWTLSAGQYFVLGDNRGNSSDSRAWGPVPLHDIIGKATLVYYPFDDLRLLPDWSGVFHNIRK